MVLNGAPRVSSWQAIDNATMPRLDRGLQEVAYAPAPTAAPDRSGVCSVVACPAPQGPTRLGRARRACGLRAANALPLAGRVGGLHPPGAGRGGAARRGPVSPPGATTSKERRRL